MKVVGGLAVAGLCLSATSPAWAQFAITGVTDKAAPYADAVTFTVGVQAGYSYAAELNRERIPVGVPITINAPDFYELRVTATNVFTATVTNRLVRFIVRASERSGTEWGLPPHVPSPVIPSSSSEFLGARLRVLAPAVMPEGLEIPVVTWILNSAGHAVRANGTVASPGQRSFAIKRGVGSGFLAGTNPVGTLAYAPSLPGLSTNKNIQIEPAPVWTTVGGPLSGDVVWPADARIRVTSHLSLASGSSLTVGSGAIVLLNPGINITNDGTITMNGTLERPVVFMPATRNQPWGGFFMRTSGGVIEAAGTIFTGSGAEQTGGPGHRKEQCLFLVDGSPRISLTDSAAIYLSGQFGHAFGGGTFRFDRFLLQRATTGGEYTGASFTVNDSAFIEFPDDSPTFADGDNDALYFVSGTHAFTNTLFGWTKDDGIDSGGSGYGPLTYQSCWFESTFHEGNSLSGYKNVVSRDSVYIDCGQGIENGYNAPTNRMDHCLFLGNKIGVRHGDNYDAIGNYDGRETVTNSISIYNHRDVFGFNWHSGAGNGWTNATGQMTIRDNRLTTPNEYFPDNAQWDPSADASTLNPFLTIPVSAPVGVGLAVRTNQFATAALAAGVPIRLSTFTTHPVGVSYGFFSPATGLVGAGQTTFLPGETVRRIYPAGFDVAAQASWDLVLTGATGAELTGVTNVAFAGSIAIPEVGLAVSGAALPGYRAGEGTFVRLNGATAQPVSVDYRVIGDGAVLASGTLTFNPPESTKRLLLGSVNPFAYSTVDIVLANPQGATLGPVTSVRYENPATAVSFGVVGAQADLALLEAARGLPVSLNGPAGGSVSVKFAVEESGRVLTNGVLTITSGEVSRLLTAPTVVPGVHSLLRVRLSDPTGAVLGTPASVYLVRFISVPPPTNTTLIATGSVWRYRDVASAAPAGWQATAFDDSGWPSGRAQLGFSNGEERDEATLITDNDQITSYFRHAFTVADPTAYAGLSYWLLRDDAGVVYLNGTEIFRSPNLPAAPATITYATTSGSPNGENTVDTGTTNRNALRAGNNVVAVEIHQQSATSSDLSFDFGLVGLGAPATVPQNLQFGDFDGRLTIAWGDAAFILEQTDELRATGTVWIPVGPGSPATVDANTPRKFFRLRKP